MSPESTESTPSRRYTVKWVEQNLVEVIDEQTDDLWYMNGHAPMIRRYESLPPLQANIYFEGYMEGVNWCDSQLKHVEHNFLWKE